MYVYRDQLEPELEALGDFLKKGDVFLDVGANAGVFSMKAAQSVGEEGVVVAVEPTPHMAARLQANAFVNEFSNVRVRVCCASDSSGFADFFMNRSAPNSFSLIKEKDSSAFSSLTVTLDWLVINEGLERLDYLKIDAEGAEGMILEGAKEAILKFRPLIQIEVNKQDPDPQFAQYRKWQSHQGSANTLFIPEESECNQIAKDRGWSCD